MDRVAIDLGFIQIYWYSVFIFLGALMGSIVIAIEAKKHYIEEDFLVNLTFNTILFGLIGARLYYVLFNTSYYMKNPVEILEIWKGGLAIHGGILFGLLFIIYYTKKNKVDTLKMLDIIVVGLILGQAIGRWGNFFNSEAYGAVTTLEALQNAKIPEFVIKGMYIMGDYHQPTFFYESMWCLFGFFAMLIFRRYRYLKVGQLSGFYLVWYGVERFIVEGMRTDSLMLGPFKIAQIVSVFFVICGLFLFFYKKRGSKFENLYREKIDVQKQISITKERR